MSVLLIPRCKHGCPDVCLACYDEELERLRAENATLKHDLAKAFDNITTLREQIDQDEGLLKIARDHAAFVADENATLRQALKNHAEEAEKMVNVEPVAYLVEFDTGVRSLVFADENWNRIAKDTPGMVKLIASPQPK